VTASGLPTPIKSIRGVTKKEGLYTPLTASGDILVNGMLASSYTSVDCLDGFLSKQLMHWLSHGTMAPYRLYCAVTGGCQDETYNEKEGSNPWIRFLSSVHHNLLDSSSSLAVKALIVLGSAIPFVFFVVLGKLLIAPAVPMVAFLVAAIVGCYAWRWVNKNQQQQFNKAVGGQK